MQGRNNRFAEKIFFTLTVPKCICCRARLNIKERALCSSCIKSYENTKNRDCPKCGKMLYECGCTNPYLANHFVKGLAKIYRYRQTEEFAAANSIVYRLKKKNRKDAVDFISDELVLSIKKALPELPQNTVITNVPNRKKAIADMGFDHAEELAKAVAEKLGLEYKKLLRSLAKRPQKEMTDTERFSNANFELLTEDTLKGRFVIIIDDIVTTGASMGNSATMIRALRPKAIFGACIGISRIYE